MVSMYFAPLLANPSVCGLLYELVHARLYQNALTGVFIKNNTTQKPLHVHVVGGGLVKKKRNLKRRGERTWILCTYFDSVCGSEVSATTDEWVAKKYVNSPSRWWVSLPRLIVGVWTFRYQIPYSRNLRHAYHGRPSPQIYHDMLRNDTSTIPVKDRQDTPSSQQHRPVGARASSPTPSSFSAAPYVGRDLFDNAANGCSQRRPVASAPEPSSASASASASAPAPVAEMFVGGSASEGSWCGPGPTSPVTCCRLFVCSPRVRVMTVIGPLGAKATQAGSWTHRHLRPLSSRHRLTRCRQPAG